MVSICMLNIIYIYLIRIGCICLEFIMGLDFKLLIYIWEIINFQWLNLLYFIEEYGFINAIFYFYKDKRLRGSLLMKLFKYVFS